MRPIALVFVFLTAVPAAADMVVPLRTIRPTEVIRPTDIAIVDGEAAGTLARLSEATGKEARIALYAGRPIRAGDLAPPALVARNDTVILTFTRGALHIIAEGRALDRAAEGETLRVMNLASRATVIGRVRRDGSIEVQ